MTASVQPATKKDVEDIITRVIVGAIDHKIVPLIQRIVGDSVGEIVGDALQSIAERFDKVDERFDRIEVRLERLEDKLDRTAATVDLHTVDIRQISRKFI